MAKILCIADAPGPAEFLAPVIPFLTGDFDVRVVAVDTAMSVLKSFDPIECNDETLVKELFKEIKPDLLVSGISSLTHGPYVNNAFVEIAYEHKVPIISLQDYWANHRALQNKKIISRAAAVCVPDEFAASLWKEDGFNGKIFITGNPAFDRFLDRDVKKEREHLREQLHLGEKDRVILFAGQGTPMHIESDKTTFAFLCEAIRGFSRGFLPLLRFQRDMAHIKIIARPHPRAQETSYYQGSAHGIDSINTSFAQFSEDVLPLADVAVSMFSTNLIHACYLRIPAISVLLPMQGRAILQRVGLDDFPPNVSGATVGIYQDDPTLLRDVFEKIFTDNIYRQKITDAQKKYFPLAEGAAQRVAEMIMRYLV